LYSFRTAFQAISSARHRFAPQIERTAFAALLVLVLCFALEAWRYPITIGDFHLSNLEIWQLLVVGLWIVSHALRVQGEQGWRRLPRGLTAAIGLWIVVLGVSTFIAPAHREQAFTFDTRIVRGVMLAWVTFDLTTSSERWKSMIRCLALAGIIVAVVGLAEAANIASLQDRLADMRGATIRVGELFRLSSTLSHPNIAAIVIELTLFPTLAWGLETRKRWLRVCLGAGLAVELVALVLTFSRGGLIAFLVSLVVVGIVAIYYHDRRVPRQTIILGGAAVVTFLTAAVGLLVSSNPPIQSPIRCWPVQVYG
jgi:hypothetical protein